MKKKLIVLTGLAAGAALTSGSALASENKGIRELGTAGAVRRALILEYEANSPYAAEAGSHEDAKDGGEGKCGEDKCGEGMCGDEKEDGSDPKKEGETHG